MAASVRKASLDDYDDVMAITKNATIYDGHDYLSLEFNEIITHHEGYILIVENQVIGFMAVIMTDGGTSFNTKAGRIREDFQNRGLYKFLTDTATELVLDAYPSVTSRRMFIQVHLGLCFILSLSLFQCIHNFQQCFSV